jgi:uncharacterized membrane protein
MARSGLTVVVIGYDDADTALLDYRDLVQVTRERDLHDCEAAVLRRSGSKHEVLASTVDAKEGGTWLGACLGVVVGIAVSPAIAAVVVGGGLGALVGNVIDQADAFRHTTKLQEAERLIDDSAANLIAIADESTSADTVSAALSRDRRIVAEIAAADTEALERELQREGLHWRS